MKMIKIGRFDVPAQGYGAMVLEGIYGGVGEEEAVNVLRTAVKAGIRHIDTADAYGNGHNERLVAQALESLDGSVEASDIMVATKVGIVDQSVAADWGGRVITSKWSEQHQLTINLSREYLTWAVDQSLQRLGRSSIDLLYLHFMDPEVLIEDAMDTLKQLHEAGKIESIGLSNLTADELRRAHAIHPVAAVQYEYSLQNRSAEDEMLPVCRELGIPFIAWAPLGSGLLAGGMSSLDSSDFRAMRFKDETSFTAFQSRLREFVTMAQDVGVSPAQLALAWLYHQGDDIMTIPGTRKTGRIPENLAAMDVHLSEAQLQRLDELSADNGFSLTNML